MYNPSQTTLSDRLIFAREWLRAPLQVAAAAPSSEALARLMTEEVSCNSAPVIELGPGSGVFTRALLSKGVPEEQIALIEQGSLFQSRLRHHFPEASIHPVDASSLRHRRIFGKDLAGVAISGLPLLSMTKLKVYSTLLGAFRNLRSDAGFYQFTYGLSCPVSQQILLRLGLTAKRIGWTVKNLPPASVYKISRNPSVAGSSLDQEY